MPGYCEFIGVLEFMLASADVPATDRQTDRQTGRHRHRHRHRHKFSKVSSLFQHAYRKPQKAVP